MIDWIFNNFDKKTISIKKSSTFPCPNLFFFFIITKCACFTIWTSFALKIIYESRIIQPIKTMAQIHDKNDQSLTKAADEKAKFRNR